ncbi:MAG: polysaccharide deacetylase [Lachnospiraceae bacterium]|nr:polysaccharide deacetylase [Lachnospiraceae bacterium]
MRKTIYIICLCLLSVLMYCEMEYNLRGSNTSGLYVPTPFFASQVKAENEKKTAYLTFDDGPSENTRKILETLQEKKAVATFFLIGNEITPERENIVKQTVAQGNAVGVHTYCHEKNKLYSSAEGFFEDFEQASKAIQTVTGKVPKLHRFPWGSNNGYVSSYVDTLHEKLQDMGVRSYDWNVSGEDSIGGTVAQSTIFQNVKKDVTRYQQPIILLHDSATMKNTAAVLGEIIDYIRDEGYEFDTLDNREEYMFPASWR